MKRQTIVSPATQTIVSRATLYPFQARRIPTAVIYNILYGFLCYWDAANLERALNVLPGGRPKLVWKKWVERDYPNWLNIEDYVGARACYISIAQRIFGIMKGRNVYFPRHLGGSIVTTSGNTHDLMVKVMKELYSIRYCDSATNYIDGVGWACRGPLPCTSAYQSGCTVLKHMGIIHTMFFNIRWHRGQIVSSVTNQMINLGLLAIEDILDTLKLRQLVFTVRTHNDLFGCCQPYMTSSSVGDNNKISPGDEVIRYQH